MKQLLTTFLSATISLILVASLKAQTTNIGGQSGINNPSSSSGGAGCNPGSNSSMLKGNGSGGCQAAVAGTDFAPATSGMALLKGNSAGGFLNATPAIDYAPPPVGSAILKGNNAGGFTNAVPSTDYAPATAGNALLKGNGSGGFSNAASGTDYAPATSGLSLLKGNGAGGFALAVAKTDYAPATLGSANAPLLADGAGGFMVGSRSGPGTQFITGSGGAYTAGDILIVGPTLDAKDGGAPAAATQINLCTIGGTTSGSAQVFEYIASQNKRVVVSFTNYTNITSTPQNCSLTSNGGSAYTQSAAISTQSEPYATIPLGSPPTSINLPYNMTINPAPINGQTFVMDGQ